MMSDRDHFCLSLSAISSILNLMCMESLFSYLPFAFTLMGRELETLCYNLFFIKIAFFYLCKLLLPFYDFMEVIPIIHLPFKLSLLSLHKISSTSLRRYKENYPLVDIGSLSLFMLY